MFDDDYPLAEQEPVDYTASYNKSYGENAMVVHAVGKELLVLRRLREPYRIWSWGKRGRRRLVTVTHVLESSALSVVARPDHDDYCRVEYGPEEMFLTKADVKPALAEIAKTSGSLFRCFQLFA